MSERLNRIHFIVSLTLTLAVGVVSGFSLGYFRAKSAQFPEFKTVGEMNPGVTTVKLLEVRNGQLVGKLSGREGRIAYSPTDILTVPGDGDFSVPLNKIHLKDFYAASDVKDGVNFIASKNGKLYYSVMDKRAFGIVLKNRLTFASAAEAEKAGFRKPK